MQKQLLNNFKEDELIFLQNLLNTSSPSGNEYELVREVSLFLNGVCNLQTDSIGNLYIRSLNHTTSQIMITAHGDEVGFQITQIDTKGFCYMRRLGGLDKQTIPGTVLCVSGKDRSLIGVMGKTPPHIQNSNDKEHTLDLNSLWVDFGFSDKEEAESQIEIGDYLTAYPNYYWSNNGTNIISKGLDNKISVFILAVSMKRLAISNLLPTNIVGVVTTQEEIGCRGSIIATQNIKPKIAICLDVGITTDIPNGGAHKELSLFNIGKGFGLCITPDNNPKLTKLLKTVCIEKNIPFQISTALRPAGGTETARIQLENGGIPVCHISIPNRYMHSCVEMCNINDAYSTVNLLENALSMLSEADIDDFNLFTI